MAHADAARDGNLIAVGTDFTPASRTALERATQIARSTGSRLLLVHVVSDSAVVSMEAAPGAVDTSIAPTATTEGRAALRGAKDLAEERIAADASGVAADAVVVPGTPWEALAETAEQRGARLLVVGVRAALAPHESFFLGTTAERTLRHGSTPVLLAREKVHGPYRHLLIPIDMGESSLPVLALVARTFPDAEYDVVHFVSPNAPHEAKTREHREAVASEIYRVCVQAELDAKRTRTRVFVAEARHGIIGECRDRRPDLIAMGTHARSGIARLLLGSVADYVIHAASGIDVLAVPPKKG